MDGKSDRYYVSTDYVQAIEQAGGIPFLLPYVSDEDALNTMVASVDAILLPGGVDLDPVNFMEEPIQNLGKVDPDWDNLELTVARLALESDIPILGICRGVQVLNVAAGGSLYQDIPSQIKTTLKHYQSAPRWHATHEVHVEADTKTYAMLGAETIRVNSFHHQSVKAVAPDFKITAKARDAVIEAIESKVHRFAVGVQWHPECMLERYPSFVDIFKALVDAGRDAALDRSTSQPGAKRQLEMVSRERRS